jgi:hypothetical protein
LAYYINLIEKKTFVGASQNLASSLNKPTKRMAMVNAMTNEEIPACAGILAFVGVFYQQGDPGINPGQHLLITLPNLPR